MSNKDQAIGLGLILFGIFSFVYYFTWAVILPFLPEDSALQSFFLGGKMVIYLPLAILVIGVTLITAFILSVLSKKANKKKAT